MARGLLGQGAADPGDGDNFRARCRRIVSGQYAAAWNESHRARESIILAEGALQKLKPELQKIDLQLNEHLKKMKAAQFSSKLMDRRDQLVAQEKLLNEQIIAQEDLHKSQRQTAQVAENTHKNLAVGIDRIFTRSFVDDPEGKPRKIFYQLEWKTPCPKYRALCPLSGEQARELKSLVKSIEDADQDCTKYANLK